MSNRLFSRPPKTDVHRQLLEAQSVIKHYRMRLANWDLVVARMERAEAVQDELAKVLGRVPITMSRHAAQRDAAMDAHQLAVAHRGDVT